MVEYGDFDSEYGDALLDFGDGLWPEKCKEIFWMHTEISSSYFYKIKRQAIVLSKLQFIHECIF